LGVRAHSGWAATILLGGSREAPEILDRRRVELCDPKIAGSKQPFHEAEPMDFAKAQSFIARCTASSAALADKAVSELRERAKTRGHALAGCCLITASGRALPELKKILASHSLIHAAEGEFYRDAVAGACARARIKSDRVKEREIMEWAASRIGIADTKLKSRIDAMGKELGPPWTADQKLATLAAWLTLDA